MNIFILDRDPQLAARMQCDKHVPKMVVESAQMLASAARRHGAPDEDMPLTQQGSPYKGGHKNHPCTLWSGDCRENFEWLLEHATELSVEYTFRFGKVHACANPIGTLAKLRSLLPKRNTTSTFAQAMPDEYRQRDAVAAYREFYKADKARFAKWDKGRSEPDWWIA